VITLYEYIAKPGDTLSKIAEYYGVSPEFIASANPKLRVEPGQRVIIPISKLYQEIQFKRRHKTKRDQWYED
jgi:LysM repeat protein